MDEGRAPVHQLIAQTPTRDRRAQVSLRYRRQNYDSACSMLGVARAARYFAVEANGIGKEGRNWRGTA